MSDDKSVSAQNSFFIYFIICTMTIIIELKLNTYFTMIGIHTQRRYIKLEEICTLDSCCSAEWLLLSTFLNFTINNCNKIPYI